MNVDSREVKALQQDSPLRKVCFSHRNVDIFIVNLCSELSSPMYITDIKFACFLGPITSHNFNFGPDMLRNNSMLLCDIFVETTRVPPAAPSAIITPGSKLL